jgi:gliding motility-associated-like protein
MFRKYTNRTVSQNLFRKWFIFAACLLTAGNLSAQAPSNDDPCNAIELIPAETCTYQTFSNADATGSTGVPAPGCANYQGGDVWFRVTVPAGGQLIFDSQTDVITDGGMAIYSGTCDNLTLISCDDDASANGLMPKITASGLTPGSTVWVRFWEYGNNNNGTFGICVQLPPPPPSNDDPCNATVLNVESTCTYQTFTNQSATGSTGVPAPGCANYLGGDVWFQVVVPVGGLLYIDTDEGVMTDGGMAVYTGTCDNLTLLSCDDNSSANGTMPKIVVNGQTPGTILWVRVWEAGNNNNGTFGICVSIPPPPPANDDPCNAIELIPANDCVYQTFTTENASGTTGVPAPGCANYQGGDVWFRVTVPAGGQLLFDTQTGVITDGGMAVYSGTCDNLTLISCNDDSSPNGLMPLIEVNGITPGSTLWVRVWEYGNDNPGTFGICVKIPPPPPTNDNPCNAISLTAEQSCTYQYFTNVNATATATAPAPGCANYLGGDVWFQAIVPPGGAIDINTDDSVMLDGGMAVYTGTCDNLTLLSCDDNSSENGNMPRIIAGGLTPGSTVWIRIWEAGNNNNGIFGICITIPPPPPANDEPCAPTVLTASTECNFQTFSNASATGSSGVSAPTCAAYAGFDVWFQVVVPPGGALKIDTRRGTMLDGGMSVYTGFDCTTLTEIACDDNSSSSTNMPRILLNGQAPGSDLWIRVWSKNGIANLGTFDICVQIPPPPPANDEPCTATILPVNSSCVFQSFTNESSFGTTGVANPTCGTYAGFDVWFKVTVPPGGAIEINTRQGTMADGAMAVYSGFDCNTLTEIACDDNSSASTGMPFISLGGLPPGSDVWIRMWSNSGAANAGTFDICVSTPAAQPITFNFSCGKDTTLGCGNASGCFSLSTVIPNIHSSTSDYEINPTSQFGCFRPDINPGIPGAPTNLNTDDRYTDAITLPFTFPFYGNDYNQVVVSTNGYVAFDVTEAGAFSHYSILNNNGALSATTGTPQDLPSALYDRALIMGPYHDINPFYTTSPNRKIKYNVVGVAPNRKWVVSYYKIPLYYTTGGCDDSINNTHQIVLYEGTGIIEVFIYEKQNCPTWNQGRAMIGLQNFDRTQGIMAPGRRASDAPWGLPNMNETWRFVPSAGPTLFRRVLLFDTLGNQIGIGDTSSINATNFRVNFNNVCPVVNEQNAVYIVKSFYTKFDNPNEEVVGADTIRVSRTGTGLSLAVATSNVRCNGGTDGTITVTPTSGTAPYQYAIDGGTFQSGNSFTVGAGTYRVTVKDQNNCSKDSLITVSQPAPIRGVFAVTNVRCNGGSDGTITVTASDGQAPYTYSSGGGVFQSGNVFTLPAGTYTLSIKDANNCVKDSLITISQPAPISGAFAVTNVRCNGGSDGTITVTASDGQAPYTYSSGGGIFQSGNQFILTAGSYTISIKDANNCVKDSVIVLTQPQPIATDVVTTSPRCNGQTNGTIVVNASNGTAPFSYSIDNGANYQSGNSFNVGAGTYRVRVKDANNCEKDSTVTITEPSLLTASGSSNNATCSELPNGQITVNAGGGIAPYTYSIDGTNFQSGSGFTTGEGNYTVTVKDANNCLANLPLSVGFTYNLTLRSRPDTAVCDNVSVRLNTVSNASTFSWIPTQSLDNPSAASPLASPTVTTEYIVLAQLGNCTQKDTVLVTVTPTPTVSAGNDVTVVKGENANIAGSVSNSTVSYIWSPATYLSDVNSLSPLSVRPDATITYRLTAVNGVGCSAFDEMRVIVLPVCIKVKNAFTPNGDGVNDNWMVYDQYDCLQNVTVQVFNRYGSKVYESRNYRNDWKGTYNGQSLPDGTYYYVIGFKLLSGRVQEVRGDVTIMR